MTRHLRQNAVAYLALFVALGGTGAYAAGKITSSDIKDNAIKGKDIGSSQVTGADLRDESATGADIANGSVDGNDVKDAGLTGADIADKSIGGGKVDPATKVPNSDMLDGHGSTRYGVGLVMGEAVGLGNGNEERYPMGVTSPGGITRAVSPETLELRDFTAFADNLGAGESITVTVVNGTPNTPICVLTTATPTCHLQSSQQWEVLGQTQWALQFSSAGLANLRTVSYSYRSVR